MVRGAAALAAALWCTGGAAAAELVEIAPVTDRVLSLHIVDGRAAPAGWADRLEEAPLDVKRAGRTRTWTLTSPDDSAWRRPVHPVRVGRKSKGRDYVTVLKPSWKIIHTNEHWIFLVLPAPMRTGFTYRVEAPGLGVDSRGATLRFDPAVARSEAVQVNQIGYAPDAPSKTARVSAWLGDLGPLNFDDHAGARFILVGKATGRLAYTGTMTVRKRLSDGPDGGQPNEGNDARADVWECDFSAFHGTGEFVVAVDGIGCSFPFKIAPDAYRPAFKATMKGLYQQRCGTALAEPYTSWTRSACHRPDMKPVLQSTIRRMDRQCDACQDVEATTERRAIWGGYHDAGDWDREDGHALIPGVLAFAYLLSPSAFRDGELNLPESGNGLPDILDEALWGLDYSRRLQRPDGGVSVGLFLDSFPDPGESPAADTGHWYCYAEEPQASYRYAASAGRVARALVRAGRPWMATGYLESAGRAWAWAETHQRPGDTAKVRDDRLCAATALFAATGAAGYHAACRPDLELTATVTGQWTWPHDAKWAAWDYALCDRPEADAGLKAGLAAAAVAHARADFVATAAKRSARDGGDWWRPLQWGAAAVPNTLPAAVAWRLTGDHAFRDVMHTGCDFTLGENPLNTCWITGVGSRPPEGVFHPDSWTSPHPEAVAPGIVPEGPSAYAGEPPRNSGPWDVRYVQASAYPPAKIWPPHELYFAARQCYQLNEFTVIQNALAAACYGLVCADGAR